MTAAVTEAIRRARVVPVVRAPTAGQAHDEVSRLLGDRFGVVELTATVPGWREVLAEVRAAAPDLVLGLGTVTTATDAEAAAAGGADFLVTPFPAPGVREAAGGVPVIGGGFSPGEVAAATAYGLGKLFPAHLGGPAYLRTLLAILPGAEIMPTGGIAPEAVDEWLAAGAVAVGINSERLRAAG